MKRYNLSYADGDPICGIKMFGFIDKYRVVLESVDGKLQKHKSVDNYALFHILYAVIVTILFAAAVVVYAMACSTLLRRYWPEYAMYYVLAGLGLLFSAAVIGGYWLFETISRKGGF